MRHSFVKHQPIWIGAGLFLLALLARLPYLGSYMTIDEVKWVEGAGQFTLGLAEGDLFATYWHFHPGITVTWLESLILWGLYLPGDAASLTAFIETQLANLPGLIGPMRLSPVLLTALAVAGIYGLARPLLGERAALLGAGLLAVDPFFVGHSRIVNGDAGAAALMMLTFLAFANLWRDQRWRVAVLAGVLGGLAALTKLPAPIIFAWLGVLAAAGALRDRRWRFWLLALAVAGASGALTFMLLFPAMWVAPLETLRLIYVDAFAVGEIGEGHDTFFLGQISNDPGWFFYPLAIAYRLTPLTVLGLLALFIWPWAKKDPLPPSILPAVAKGGEVLSPPPGRGRLGGGRIFALSNLMLLALVGYVIFIWLFANASPKKLDRYVMAMIPPLLLLAGFGLNWLIGVAAGWLAAKTRWRTATLSAAAGLLLVAAQAGLVIANYPYVLTYYNPLLGGFAGAVERVPVGWGEGMEQAAAWLNARPNAGELKVSSWYSDMVRPYLHTETTSFSSSGEGQLEADYVLFYINQAQRQKPDAAVYTYFSRKTPAFRVDYRGTPYVWVYPAPGMQVSMDGDARIEGRARLLGYNWQPAPPARPGDSAELTLFLRTTGDLPANETFRAALAAPDGRLWGAWEPAEPVAWQPDAIIEWSGALSLPADMPPGDYQLIVQLIDRNIDGEVTRFPPGEQPIRLN